MWGKLVDRKKSCWSANPNLLFSFDPSYVLDAQSNYYLPKETSSRETTEIADPLCVFGRWKNGPSRCRQQQQRLSSRQPGPSAGAQVSGQQQQNRTIQKVQFKPRLKAMWNMWFNPTSYYVDDFFFFFLSFFTAGFRDEVTVGPSRGPTR